MRSIPWVAGEARVKQEIQLYEREKQMPYVTSLERLAREEGLEQGRKEGLREGILGGIELVLEVRFGTEGLQLMSEVRKLQDPAALHAFQQAIKTAPSVEELRRLIP
jgi:hypothetical protein